MRSRKGFTLIELIVGLAVVLMILIPLGVSLVTGIMSARDAERLVEVKLNGHELQLAVEEWATQHDGRYPNVSEVKAIAARLVTDQPLDNPFGGDFVFVVAYTPVIIELSSPDDMDGVTVFTLVDSTSYTINCYGKDGALVLTLSNG